MRGFLASSIGVTCAAALTLPLTLPTAGHAATPPPAQESLPGTTQSLPLSSLTSTTGDRSLSRQEQGLPRRDVRPFSLVGVVWDNPDAQLHGRVQVRTRATGTTTWSTWQDVETHNDDAPDPDAPERTSGTVHGATAPLWVGDSDGVEVRVKPDTPTDRTLTPPTEPKNPTEPTDGTEPLPKGLRLELVDPGEDPPPSGAESDTPRGANLTAEAAAASAVNADLAPLGATTIPALTKKETEDDLIAARGGEADATKARPYVGPRPRIITRKGWGADEKLRERDFVYTKTVKAAFIHHSASGNNYRCSQASSVIRSIYRYHVKSSGWRDIGYNFLVDKCGNIYEGRAGGVTKPVMGAHTLGFNTNSMGIAVLGTFGSSNPPAAAVNAIARLTAWKLGLYGANPRGTTYLKSGGGNLYRKGKNVRLKVISGHRDGFATECPGRRLYKKLGTARSSSAHLQGR
ncbi:peptidoglycan recognition protein [Streptomyces sp. VRA16 Mangrove soil]|uniref:peptidoglycan recognition protein family protein n=1 Tax=Streptomyces sp. VRA16 Mangrove soil TaxID=2817434 RepID=UPI001A9F1CAB|nr:peptidoglycan recognition protein [Streptomyces sp. VRA16 Mangrove soil]MBO1336653.1 N-acetylmuramoyl-L-alanine amidase [Streptomyces sp. VRA16 Mangrove soil]